MKNIIWFEHLRMTDVAEVGGKNASLGEMISQLDSKGIRVPGGFATTAEAYKRFLESNNLKQKIDLLVEVQDKFLNPKPKETPQEQLDRAGLKPKGVAPNKLDSQEYNLRLNALQEYFNQGLIAEEDYNAKVRELQNERIAVIEENAPYAKFCCTVLY